MPGPERRYSVVIELYDHTSTTFESSPLHPRTRTRLPPRLDRELLASQKSLVLPSGSFWRPLPLSKNLSTTNSKPIASPPLGPPRRAPQAWSETSGPISPPLIATADLFTPSQAIQKATLDFRFGPLSIDFVDSPTPESYPPMTSSPVRTSLSPPLPSLDALSLNESGSNSLNLSIPTPMARTRSTTTSKNANPSGGASTSAQAQSRPPETSGTTDLYWGTIHLFREAGASEESNDKAKRKALDDDDGTVVGLVSVPGVLTAAALLVFISPALDSIMQLRMLRDSTPNRTLVLIRFRDASDASEFRTMYNGRPYHDTKDSELCHVVPISSIQLKTSNTPPFTFPYPSKIDTQSTEVAKLPTCPICLERLDVNVSGLISQLCSHDAHCECLLKWGDSRCPVCRQTNIRNRRGTNTAPPPSLCTVCQSPSNLWICVICGNVGCGRYQGGHAHSHFEESGHTYSLEIETGRVWSYGDDEYVHRLIRSRTDGKLVELPSMFGNNGRSADASNDNKDDGMGLGGPDRSTEASQDKLEAMGVEYANLMTSQLESQRGYYEEEIARGKDEISQLRKKRETLEREKEGWKHERGCWEKRLKEMEEKAVESNRAWQAKWDALQKRHAEDEQQRKKEKADAVKMRKELEKELESERAVTRSLTENLGHLRIEMGKRDVETTQVRAEVEDLKDQMRDVMFALSARDQIQAEGGASEAAGGTIITQTPPASTPSTPGSAQRRRKKK